MTATTSDTAGLDSAEQAARRRILEGPLAWAAFRLGAPLALAMVFQVLFNLVDQYLVSRLPPEVANPSLDALGICDMVAALGTIISYGVSTATATLVSQAHGRGDDREVARLAWGSLGLVTLLGVAFGLVGVFGADVIAHDILGAKGAVRALAVSYLRVILGGVLTVFVMFQITSIQRALGQSRLPLATFVAGNVINLFLAVLLVYGDGDAPWIFSWGPPIARALHVPRLEVAGAAWASVLARAVVCAVPIAWLARSLKVSAHGASFVPSREVVSRIVGLAWPTSAQFTVRIGAVLLVIALVHHGYTTATNSDAGTAYALCLRMETMALFVSMGWGGAGQTIVGMCLGAEKRERATRAGWIVAAYNAATMALLATLFITAGERFLRFFTGRDEIVSRALAYLLRVGPSYVPFGVAIVLSNAIVGAGASRLALVADSVLVLGVQLPLMLIVVAALRVEPNTLWDTLVVVNVITAVAYALIYRNTRRWQKP